IRQERQIPNELPLPMMLAHRFVILAFSSELRVAGANCVSVSVNGGAGGFTIECMVVPHAIMPCTTGNAGEPASAALLVQMVPVNVDPAPVASSLTTNKAG